MNFPLPPNVRADENAYESVRKYLFRLVEQLNNSDINSSGTVNTTTQNIGNSTMQISINRNTARIAEIQSHIRYGIVAYQGETPILGIAIGNEVSTTGETEVVYGVVREVIDTSGDVLIWTPTKLSLIHNGQEIAYLSGTQLKLGSTTMSEAQLQALLLLI